MISLNYKQYGETGQPLIILHGFLGSLDNWHTLAGEWSKAGFKVYTLDQRNHGKSPHTMEHSLQLMSDDLLDFMEQQQIPEAIILGHSMGGKVAMQFALQHPAKTIKLIAADIAPRAYKPGGHDEVFKAIFNVDLKHIQTRKEAEEAMKPFLGDFGTRQFVLKSLERTENGFDWKFNIDTLFREYNQAIMAIEPHAPVQIPALFIRGGLSLYVQEKDHADILALFPQAKIETIPHAGHWLHADKPKEFFDAVSAFMKG